MDEFTTRRAALAKQLRNNSIALLAGAQLQIRNGDVDYPFRQDSNFYYLTGFDEPEAVLVLSKDAAGKITYILFNRANDPDAEIWNGKRAGQVGACQDYAADEAYDILTIDKQLPKLLANKEAIYYPLGAKLEFDQRVLGWLQVAKNNLYTSARSENQTIFNVPDTIIDLLPMVHELRLFKSEQEIEYMRQAASISAAGHLRLMQSCQPGQMEYQLEAVFNAYCLELGCRGLAYNSIVAGGNNSCTLHYTANDQALRAGDLVLIDAGGEYKNYAADITRTFPVNGKFNPEQRQIYALVLQAQLAGIEQVKPGNKWNAVQDAMVKIIVNGLLELGILTGDSKQLIKDKAFRKFYMHGSGHWLGLDVHDAGKYKQQGNWRAFEPGMVLTVEPGIYIAKDTPGIDAKWYGIGIRIEDDVLVTKKGNEVLSSFAPKSIEEIERATG